MKPPPPSSSTIPTNLLLSSASSKLSMEGCALWWYDFLKLPLFSSSLINLQPSVVMNSSSLSSPKPYHHHHNYQKQNWWSLESVTTEWKSQPEALTIARLALTLMHPNEVNERILQSSANRRNHHSTTKRIGVKSSGFYVVQARKNNSTTNSSTSNVVARKDEESLTTTSTTTTTTRIPLHLYVTTLELFCRRYTTDPKMISPIEKNKIRSAFWKLAAFIAYRVVELEPNDIARALSVVSEVPPPSSCGWDLPIFFSPPSSNNDTIDKNNNNNRNNSMTNKISTTARDVCSYLSCQARLKARRYNALLAMYAVEENYYHNSHQLFDKNHDVDVLKNHVMRDLLAPEIKKKQKQNKINSDSYNNTVEEELSKYSLTKEKYFGHSSTSVVWSFVIDGRQDSSNDNNGNSEQQQSSTSSSVYELPTAIVTATAEPKSQIKKKEKGELSTTSSHYDDIPAKAILTQLIKKKPMSMNEMQLIINQKKTIEAEDKKKHNEKKQLFFSDNNNESNIKKKKVFGPKERRRALIKRAEELLMLQSNKNEQKPFSSISSTSTSTLNTVTSSSIVSSALIWTTFDTWSDFFHQLSPQARTTMIVAATETISHSLPTCAPQRQHFVWRRLAEATQENSLSSFSSSGSSEVSSSLSLAVAKSAFKSLLGYKELAGKLLHSSTALIKSLNTLSLGQNKNSTTTPVLLSPFEIIPKLSLASSVPKEILGICAIQLSLSSTVFSSSSSSLSTKTTTRLNELVPSAQLHTSSGNIQPSESMVIVMKFLGEYLFSPHQSNSNGKQQSDHSLFLDRIVQPLMKMMTKTNNNSSNHFSRTVLKSSSALLLDICQQLISTNIKTQNSTNTSLLHRQALLSNTGLPMLISSAIRRNDEVDNNNNFLQTSQQLVTSSPTKRSHFLKLALLQSSMLEPLGFEYLHNNNNNNKNETENNNNNEITASESASSVIINKKREELMRKICILEGGKQFQKQDQNEIQEDNDDATTGISKHQSGDEYQKVKAVDLMIQLLEGIPSCDIHQENSEKAPSLSPSSSLLSQAQCELVFEAKSFLKKFNENNNNSDKTQLLLKQRIFDMRMLIDKLVKNRKDIRQFLKRKQKIANAPKELELKRKRNMAALGLI